MALTLLNTLPAVVPAKNPVGVKLQTDNYIITPAVKAQLYLVFTGGAANYDTLSITWANAQVNFQFVTTPDDSGNQLPKYVSGDIDVWLETLLIYIGYNYYIHTDFNISITSSNSSSGTIRFIAKNAGLDYNLTIIENVSNCTTSLISGADAVVNANFLINLNVFYYNGSHWVQTVALGLPPDSANQAVFFIDKFLLSILENRLPVKSEKDFINCTWLVNQFRFIYTESYGEVSAFKKTIISSSFHAVRAGFSFIDFPGLNYFTTWLPLNKKFMTWQPNFKKVIKTQDELLNYLVFGAAATTLNLKVKCYYSDGTTETKTVKTKTSVSQKQIYQLPAGYVQLNIDNNFSIPSGEYVSKYELWLTDQAADIISEVRTYVLDYAIYSFTRIFLFENSMSGFDTLRCTGQSDFSVDVTAVIIEKMLSFYWNLNSFDSKGRLSSGLNSYTDKSVVRTGYMTLQDLMWLKELFLSEIILEDRGHLVPVHINKGSFKLYTTSDDLYALEFEVYDAFSQENYSNTGFQGSGSGS